MTYNISPLYCMMYFKPVIIVCNVLHHLLVMCCRKHCSAALSLSNRFWFLSVTQSIVLPCYVQGGPKKLAPFLYALTLPNINRFSKFFYCRNQEKILIILPVSLKIPPHLNCVATLPRVLQKRHDMAFFLQGQDLLFKTFYLLVQDVAVTLDNN